MDVISVSWVDFLVPWMGLFSVPWTVLFLVPWTGLFSEVLSVLELLSVTWWDRAHGLVMILAFDCGPEQGE